MPEDLFYALRRCHAKGGWIGVVKRAEDRYELILHRSDDTPIDRVTLTYDAFRRVFEYWQRLERPMPGRARSTIAA